MGVIDLVCYFVNLEVFYVSGWDRIWSNIESLVIGLGVKVFWFVDGGLIWEMFFGGFFMEFIG